ncbi:glycosyltransferase family 32 protein [Stipitochalara longipes BDJ]|nr:glycosyltransferase family 32 protein [Stipitochalara longipes BDJ]
MKVTSPTSRFPARLPKQIQRALPIYLALILVVVFFWTAESVSSFRLAVVWDRVRAYQTSSVVTTTFTRKIWQTWKIDPLEFEGREMDRARSWTSKNPGYRYEVLTDGNDLHYVETNFGPAGLNRPDIVYFYKSLTAKIIKADLLRYLILYNEGGVYADIDVEALKPVDEWIPPHFDKADLDLVISVEIDEPNYANHSILGPKSQSFCQWTIMSKPRNPAILRIINNVINWLTDVARAQNVHVAEITLNFDDVLSGTGPSAFTTAMMSEMKHQTGMKHIPWSTFHNLTEPTLIGRILVLTVHAFASGQGHSNSGTHDDPRALVKHHYHASKWPDRHKRYSHPGYGMVEECNWKPDCVAAWDNNTALFPSLSEEEKEKVLAEKKRIDEERFNKEEEEKRQHEQEDRDRIDRETREKCEKLDPPFEMPKPKPEEEHHDDQNKSDGEQKPEDKKPEEQKSEEQKPEEKKPEDKPDEKKPEEQKPEEHKEEHKGDGWMLLQDKPDGENKVHKEVDPPHHAPIDPKPET